MARRYELSLVDATGLNISKDIFEDRGEAMGNYQRAKATLELGACSEPNAYGAWLRDLETRATLGLYFPNRAEEGA